jgi:serine/threonine-protein kinase
MATVYLARLAREVVAPEEGDRADVVAIKMIRDEFARNPEFRTMFMDEARIFSRLRHPNIVRYHDFGNEGGHLFIAMELLFGQSLWAVWDACRARKMRLPYDLIAWIGARVAEGLHYAHELVDDEGRSLEIVHRDVNATNIFVTYEGEIKIIDFGLAKAANRASKTAAGIIKGKVGYMSPEQAVGAPVDRRTDVFALGTTLWELSCDRRLFKHGDEVETLRRVHAAEVPDPRLLQDGFPRLLWRVIERALAREREGRYPTAAELTRHLDDFAQDVGLNVGRGSMAGLMRELFAGDRGRPVVCFDRPSQTLPSPRGPARPTSLSPLTPRPTAGSGPSLRRAPWRTHSGKPSSTRPVRPAVVLAVVMAVAFVAVVALFLAGAPGDGAGTEQGTRMHSQVERVRALKARDRLASW